MKTSLDVNAKKAWAIQGKTHFKILKLKPETTHPAQPKLCDVSLCSPGFQKAHTAYSLNKKFLEIDAAPQEKKSIKQLKISGSIR